MYSETKGLSSDNYVVIQGFMCNELNLKGNELLVFALIYGFCQDGKSVFSGGRKYIAETFNISMPTVDKALQGLIDRGLILKHSSGDFVHTDLYTVKGSKETLLGVVKKLYEGSKETLPNNIDNKLENNINNSTNVELEQPTVTRKSLITVDKSIKTETPHNRKKNLYEKCTDLIDEYAREDIKLKNKLIEFLLMRLDLIRLKDKPFSDRTFKSYLNKLSELANNTSDKLKIIQYSIDGQYPTFYPLKNNYKTQDKNVFSEYGKVKIGSNENEVITNVQF